MKFLYLIALLLLGCEEEKVKFITVQEHETLDIIAANYNVNTKHLIKKNQLKHPYSLKPGQKLMFSEFEVNSKILHQSDQEQNGAEQNNILNLNKINSIDNVGIDEDLKNELDDEIKKNEQSIKSEEIMRRQNSKNNAESKAKQKAIKQLKQSEQPKSVEVKILFPVMNGSIDTSLPFSQKHGKRRDGVFILSHGKVLAPYDGTIAFVDKANNSIYIKHDVGNLSWLITCSNLSSIFVEKGDTVKQGEPIGQSSGSIFIRIWNGREYINPENINYKKTV
ncbi:peptidoglycan DD-metalloendopeptidase family protein [Candidatus Cytomitobacter primus]|uniref:Peptidoglycan DD-metalloendopeptidase family protein n=1 Tax=Candidatus Cytomitobacter primus TaxID=2066024 RepID=A0A5C0UFD8_9PROT|nr:M23 family metallopeptidase [Candidatus Cytomitobacter primus]QEK38430.1 peptidoglycan DD-metalloendopeptidase family protein [Candidatus Cytomitobacter primus]